MIIICNKECDGELLPPTRFRMVSIISGRAGCSKDGAAGRAVGLSVAVPGLSLLPAAMFSGGFRHPADYPALSVRGGRKLDGRMFREGASGRFSFEEDSCWSQMQNGPTASPQARALNCRSDRQ